MTENKAIKLGKSLYKNITCNANNIIPTKEYIEFVGIAIQALEEIQQYRAIGTVEDIQSMKDNGSFSGVELAQIAIMQTRLKDYESIGTVEELKDLKEKNVAKKPYLNRKGLLDVKMWHCPVCKKEVASDWNRDLVNDYCHNCGQKIDRQ